MRSQLNARTLGSACATREGKLEIRHNNDLQHIIDAPPSIVCPHCAVRVSAIPISVPRYDLIIRFALHEVGIVARCNSCNRALFFLFQVARRSTPNNPHILADEFMLMNRAVEPFETKYLSGAVLDDFNEGLVCYASSCWNAFAAMCRRCIQSVCESFGAEGSTKVQVQLKELQAMGVADEDTFAQLDQIMLTGHDGAHPHLPPLSQARAAVLMQLMKDVLYQLYVRPAKVREAGELRKRAASS